MANEQNLQPIKKGQLSKEELKKRQSNGGKKSGQVRRERKTMKENLLMLLSMDAPERVSVQIQNTLPEIDKKELNYQNAILVSLIQQALKGNIKAVEIIRDTIGEKPTEKVDATNTNIEITDEKIIHSVVNKIKEL